MQLPDISSSLGAVILAAGKGTRLGTSEIPKAMQEIGGKPIIEYSLMTLESMELCPENICIVVGYKKNMIIDYFKDRAIFAVQDELLGTGHAAFVGSKHLPESVDTVLILQGDDSAFYTQKTLTEFIRSHTDSGAVVLSLLSAEAEASDAGKVVRHSNGDIELVEKENWTEEHIKITEINTNTLCLDRRWFEESFQHMPRIDTLGEYGLPTALNYARGNGFCYQLIRLQDSSEWFESTQSSNSRKRI